MQFLKTLMWVLLAVLLAVLASANWRDVTLDLWGSLQVDIKIPVLIGLTFLLGFVPVWLVMRGRLWRLKRRLAVLEHQQASSVAPALDPVPAPPSEAVAISEPEEIR